MSDVFQVAEILIEHALKHHAQDVDLIGYYGSYAQGTATRYSDLDIFYVPADGVDPPVGRTFLLEGRLFDFWPIRWETLAGFATGELRGWAVAPALVYHTRILYARSPEQREHFERLRDHVDTLRKPESRPLMIRRALAAFPTTLAHLELLRQAAAFGDRASIRYAAWDALTAAYECLALANQTFLDRGYAHVLRHAATLTHRPAHLESLIETLALSADPEQILQAAEQGIQEIRTLLYQLHQSLPPHATPRQIAGNAYPELKGTLDKVLSACQRGDQVAASAAARSIQHELSMMLADTAFDGVQSGFHLYHEFAGPYRQAGFVDLLSVAMDDLAHLATQTMMLDQQLRDWLSRMSIDLDEFQSLEELQRALANS